MTSLRAKAVLTNWPVGRMVMQRTANPLISVQFRYRPPKLLFRLSSAVEQSAVNRLVVGSIPTVGAKNNLPEKEGFFYTYVKTKPPEKRFQN